MGGDLSRILSMEGLMTSGGAVSSGSRRKQTSVTQASTTNACGALSLSKDSHVSDDAEMVQVPEVLPEEVGWFSSYSASNSSTWKAK
jgi:hypothetical protein